MKEEIFIFEKCNKNCISWYGLTNFRPNENQDHQDFKDPFDAQSFDVKNQNNKQGLI